MMLSGRGVATALKVPFQNFSNSCFSPCCRLAIPKSPRSPGDRGAVRSAEMWIPNPLTRPGFPGALSARNPKGWGGKRSEFWAGDGIEWDGGLGLVRQRRLKVVPSAGFTSWLGSEQRWEPPAELRVLSKAELGRLSLPRREQRGGDRGVCRACACELQRARVLSLAQCDVGRGGWSRELYFPPSPSRSPPSPATPPSVAQPPAAICITKARRSREEKGRGVRLSPRPGGH